MVLLGLMLLVIFLSCKGDVKKTDDQLKVVLLITSNLGDRGFYDSANNGMNLLKEQLGAEVKTIEMGQDPSKYEPYIRDVAEQDWDYIVVGSSPANQTMEELVPQYPNKKFIMFDTELDWSKGDFSNLYCVTYKQNEGSYLAGVVAALVTTEGERANPEKVIGCIAGGENPVISDFILGYIEGATSIDSEIKVAIAYAGTFIDSTKGKELGMAMMGQQNVDICYQVASQTGIGVLDAARELNLYAIGVDGDQEAAFKDSNPGMAGVIVTSMMKRVDQSLLRAVQLAEEGTLGWGKREVVGLKEQGVGIVYSGNFQKELSPANQQLIKDIEKKIVDGEIKVSSALGMPDAEFMRICALVKP
jgi:basic membrane protein A